MSVRKLGVIIQARVGSTRLPNKINLPFFGKETILDIIIKKMLLFKDDMSIVLSTGDNKENSVLKRYSEKYDIGFFQGSEKNVLDRFIKTANAFEFTHVLRICSDNPFLEVRLLKDLIRVYNKKDYDYYSFKDDYNVPAIKTHLGLFGEIVSLSSLKIEQKRETDINIIEHVTKYIYENPEDFRIYLKEFPAVLRNKDFLRFTIDDAIDFDNLQNLYRYYVNEGIEKTIQYIEENEEIKDKMLSNILKYTK